LGTKNLVLEHLENNRGQSLSGAAIAESLGVSRNAVWKAIKELRSEGYEISAATNRGYSLEETSDILSKASIAAFLQEDASKVDVQVFDCLPSTSRTAKELAISGVTHGTLILADTQSEGTGRKQGRSFASPSGGIYMSLVLRPEQVHFSNITHVTACAAVCVCEALETVCAVSPKIKWVNDVFIGDKKVCGILTEAVTDFESGGLGWLVLGIGINFSARSDEFPESLRDIVCSVYPDGKPKMPRSQVIAEIVRRVLAMCEKGDDSEIFKKYKSRMMLLGEKVNVIQGDDVYSATALDINEDGHLIVKTESGEIQTLFSGEVSIRKTPIVNQL